MDTIELIIGMVELGAVPIGIYFYKNLKKKLDTIHDLEKEIQAKVDIIQSLESKLEIKDLEIKMLRERP